MINLLALLVQRSSPLTLKQIRQELAGQYPESDTAARAAFERDKGDLRDLGIPVEMVTLGGDQAGEGAYRVTRKSYELEDLGLTQTNRMHCNWQWQRCGLARVLAMKRYGNWVASAR